MFRPASFVIVALLMISGCANMGKGRTVADSPAVPGSPALRIGPDVPLMKTLPVFTKVTNEVEIAASFNDVDPSWILGALASLDTGTVRSLDTFLKPGAKVETKVVSEIAFKNFVEDQLTISSSWLAFLKGQVSSDVKAEVSVTKVAIVKVASSDVDLDALRQLASNLGPVQSERYVVITAFSDYVVSASLFKNFGAGGGASGYGAKIDGNWFSKLGDQSAYHRVIATWAPLPLVVKVLEGDRSEDQTLDVIIQGILDSHAVTVEAIPSPLTPKK